MHSYCLTVILRDPFVINILLGNDINRTDIADDSLLLYIVLLRNGSSNCLCKLYPMTEIQSNVLMNNTKNDDVQIYIESRC